jgi:hypothetical protein
MPERCSGCRGSARKYVRWVSAEPDGSGSKGSTNGSVGVLEWYGPRVVVTERGWQMVLDSGPDRVESFMGSLERMGMNPSGATVVRIRDPSGSGGSGR